MLCLNHVLQDQKFVCLFQVYRLNDILNKVLWGLLTG